MTDHYFLPNDNARAHPVTAEEILLAVRAAADAAFRAACRHLGIEPGAELGWQPDIARDGRFASATVIATDGRSHTAAAPVHYGHDGSLH